MRRILYFLLLITVALAIVNYTDELRKCTLCIDLMKEKEPFLTKIKKCAAIVKSPMEDGLYMKYEYTVTNSKGDFNKSIYFLSFSALGKNYFRLVESQYGYRDENEESEVLDRFFKNMHGMSREAPNLSGLPLWVPPYALRKNANVGIYRIANKGVWKGFDVVVLKIPDPTAKQGVTRAFYERATGFFVGFIKEWSSKTLEVHLVKTNSETISL